MESEICDKLIDFFAKADIKNDTLALALLEPLKKQTQYSGQPKPNQPQQNSQLKKDEEKMDESIKSVIEQLTSPEIRTAAEQLIKKPEELQTIIKNLCESKDSKSSGDEAFLRDHNLLPKLIIHPQMTLAKILKVYPNLPCPKDFDKNANLNTHLGEWLPILANYSQTYLVEAIDNEIKELIINIIKVITEKNPRRKKKKKTKNGAVNSLPASEDISKGVSNDILTKSI